uniref:Uncharacterized protein n=1 Tax=Sphaerodactylus townsendi TaxID=933632 RepID=A0ACB8FPX8_9SAUR
MAEPRRVPFISLSPVRRREGETPVFEREPGGIREVEQPLVREALKLPEQQHHDSCRTEPPPLQPFETCPRTEPQLLPLLPREIGRPEPKPLLQPQREPPRPEPPPPPPPHQQLPHESNRQESPPPPPPPPPRQTVRLELVLKDPTEESCVEFSYPELLLCGEPRVVLISVKLK